MIITAAPAPHRILRTDNEGYVCISPACTGVASVGTQPHPVFHCLSLGWAHRGHVCGFQEIAVAAFWKC